MEPERFDDEHDLLGHKGFADILEKFIEIEQLFVPGGLVLSLSSPYGTGKTTFLKLWKAELEACEDEKLDAGDCEASDGKPLVVMLNAWDSDYVGDPLFAIVSSLVEAINDSAEPERGKPIMEAAKDIGWFAVGMAGQLAGKILINPISAGDFAEKKKAARAVEKEPELPADAFSVYEARKSAMEHLKTAIGKFIIDTRPTVWFFVDELDRCRPDYAISYLETIKHIFDIEGAVFILAADRRHLENSAKKAFGPQLTFDEYYRKFVHREVALPEIPEERYARIAETYVDRYLSKDGLRFCFMKSRALDH